MLNKDKLCVPIFISVFSFLLLFNVSSGFAQELDVDASLERGPLGGAMRKFSRGILNAACACLEVPQTVSEVSREEGVPAGLIYGLFKGILFATIRATVGVYELATFAIPIPRGYEPILKEPEFYPGEGEGLK
ncbi:MAG: exosortase system-associated protein, TIGR04073 family [Candidatus Omnitrophica bacterium]|nr:exosortase system-associated protein, TIGR04073 family [Candidatus Omnitrophota bacterium]